MEQPTIKTSRKLLMISTDRSIFEEGSEVRKRQIEYAKDWGEVHIIVFARRNFQFPPPAGGSNFQINSNRDFCVIPAKAGIQNNKIQSGGKTLDSRLHGNDNIGAAEAVLSNNCWAYSTRSQSKFLYPFDAISLGRFIVEKRGITDITCQDASLTAMAGVSLKKRFDLPLEIQMHEDIGSPHYPFNATNKIRKALALSYIPKADSIRVVSERIKKYLVETVGIDSAKITVRPIAVDIDSIWSMPIVPNADLHKKYPRFKKIILMASRLEPEKNIGVAIEAFKEVVKKVPNTGLIIVGKGSQKAKLEKLTNSCGSNGWNEPQANQSVIFEDWADKATLASYYKTADLFLNTSLFEGYGMALVEAKAAGCKIVSTDVGIAGEVGAIIVEPKPENIATAVISQIS